MVIPLIANGRLLGAVSFLSVTPSRVFGPEDLRVANELAQRAALAVDNARLYRAAQRAITVRDEVLGIVAHDLRNPLATMLMQAEVLSESASAPEREVRDAGERIKRAALRMTRLIQDLLDITRLEAGQITVEQSRVPASEIAAEAIESQRTQASSGGLQLRVDLPTALPDLWADHYRLLQVFENLIGNAIKFTPRGGTITVGATSRGNDVLFRVVDTGPGISVDDQKHLFDRFWQARTARRSGAGLGLSIAKGIVEAHGGQIWFESMLGHGSTFFFSIPVPGAARSPVRDAA
jgi:signal transduction histidine kinase